MEKIVLKIKCACYVFAAVPDKQTFAIDLFHASRKVVVSR